VGPPSSVPASTEPLDAPLSTGVPLLDAAPLLDVVPLLDAPLDAPPLDVLLVPAPLLLEVLLVDVPLPLEVPPLLEEPLPPEVLPPFDAPLEPLPPDDVPPPPERVLLLPLQATAPSAIATRALNRTRNMATSSDPIQGSVHSVICKRHSPRSPANQRWPDRPSRWNTGR
jgi:hypothetical protein